MKVSTYKRRIQLGEKCRRWIRRNKPQHKLMVDAISEHNPRYGGRIKIADVKKKTNVKMDSDLFPAYAHLIATNYPNIADNLKWNPNYYNLPEEKGTQLLPREVAITEPHLDQLINSIGKLQKSIVELGDKVVENQRCINALMTSWYAIKTDDKSFKNKEFYKKHIREYVFHKKDCEQHIDTYEQRKRDIQNKVLSLLEEFDYGNKEED